MSWEKVSSPKDAHRCSKPYYVDDGVSANDIIRCDECGQHWKCASVDYGMQWEPYDRGVLIWEKGNYVTTTIWVAEK